MSEKFQYKPRELNKDNSQLVAEAEKLYMDADVDRDKFEEFREKIHKQFQHLGRDRIPTDEEVTRITAGWADSARGDVLRSMEKEDQAVLEEQLTAETERIIAEIRAKRTNS